MAVALMLLLPGCDAPGTGDASDEMLMGCQGSCDPEPCEDRAVCEILCEAGPQTSICQAGVWTAPFDHCPYLTPGHGASCAAFRGPACEYPRYCPSDEAATATCVDGAWQVQAAPCQDCGDHACVAGELCLVQLYTEEPATCTDACGATVDDTDCLKALCVDLGCAWQTGPPDDRIMCSCL